jgi:hypothetical protein
MLAELEAPNKKLNCAELVQLGVAGLPQMLDRQQQLFCHTLRQSQGRLVREGISHRYTMMTLLGLHRASAAGVQSQIQIADVFQRLTGDTNWIEGAGDLGLLLWTCAEIYPDQLPALCEKVGARDALSRFSDARERKTMELAWYLTGLAHSINTGLPGVQHLAQQAWDTFELLIENQGNSGIFGHQSTATSIRGFVRGRIGSFADQVYPICAFSAFSKYAHKQNVLDRALACAETICRYQGANGEWWWHYDASTGNVAETYPVYSVHQHGMAPMALYAVAEATGREFTKPILKGLNWIYGNNDLQYDMRSEADGVIWRNFFLPSASRYWNQVTGSSSNVSTIAREKLRINFECRPYELGWMLYALAGK